ncbi:hypothetical protein LTR53_012884 [Teratosphaeriaceae sp. CCFEE 6253]|nr:hypothetical protein LTR53_012884 [Teratosphaeriaceae sp. CCFEE 6253]
MASTNQDIVLITGANTGLGFELAKQLLRDHGDRFYVLVGCRTLTKGGAAVKELHDQGLQECEMLHIEVIEDNSIAEAAKIVQERFGRLDVLHVNAGIGYSDRDWLPAGASLSAYIVETMRTNVAGAAQTAEAFMPLLQKADNPRLVFMSTGLGSLAVASTYKGVGESFPAYSASKAALNMVMLYYWGRFGEVMRINACAPGFRATNLNGFGAAGGPTNPKPGPLELGVRNAIRLTLLGKDGERGTFTDWKDEAAELSTVPW